MWLVTKLKVFKIMSSIENWDIIFDFMVYGTRRFNAAFPGLSNNLNLSRHNSYYHINAISSTSILKCSFYLYLDLIRNHRSVVLHDHMCLPQISRFNHTASIIKLYKQWISKREAFSLPHSLLSRVKILTLKPCTHYLNLFFVTNRFLERNS